MPLIPLAVQTYGRQGLPKARLFNLYVERTPEGPTPFSLRSRPALVLESEVGPGPIRGVTTHLGVRYIVSGTRVYRDGVQIGLLAGSERVRMAQSDEELVIVTGGEAYLVDTVVTSIVMPDSDVVSDVAFAAGRFIYAIQGSGKFRYSEVGDATDIGDLNFATAESDPDDIVAIIVLGDNILFFGETSTEWWGATTDPAAPFQRYGGRRYDVGSLCQNATVKMDNGAIWIGTSHKTGRADWKIYRTGSVAEVISTPAIDELMSDCVNIAAATAVEVPAEGRTFYVLNLPGVTTVAYDVRERTWAEWASYARTTFRVQCEDSGLYGDADTGKLWTFDHDLFTDGDDPIVRVCSCYIPANARRRLSSIELLCAKGEATTVEGPSVEMRFTNNEDAGWSDWTAASLGPTGTFPRTRWFQGGMLRPPGRQVEFRCSDDVLFTPYGVAVGDSG